MYFQKTSNSVLQYQVSSTTMLNRTIRWYTRCLLLSFFKALFGVAGACGSDVVSKGLDDGAAFVRDAAGRPPRHCGAVENGIQSDPECSIPTECPTRCEATFSINIIVFHIHSCAS